MTLLAATPIVRTLGMVVRRFGAFAFFPLGLLDMSFLAPGSFDALLVLLTVAHKDLWWYYALMATAGSVLGTWPTFQIARKGGEEALDKRLGAVRSKTIFSAFRRWGSWSIVVVALSPPPTPASAFVLAVGALHYPWTRFALAWAPGRLLRFSLLGWITYRYGTDIFHWFRNYYKPALWTIAGIVVLACAAALWYYIRQRRRRALDHPSQPRRRAA